MSSSSFANKKQLLFTITLGVSQGTFDGSLSRFLNNQINLQGFRATAEIENAGGQQNGTLRARIYGVAQEDMNAITTLYWKTDEYAPNSIVVTAIDGNQQTQVFAGNIIQAWADYQSQPDVFLHIQAATAYVNQLTPVTPSSYQGTVDVATIAAQITNTMSTADLPLSFENNGVTTQLSNAYLPGTAMDQLRSLVRAAGCDLYLEGNVVAICPKGTARAGLVPLISPQTGLAGYPTVDGTGVYFKCLFNPSLRHGGSVQLSTSVQKANGQWLVSSVSHLLESEKPGGAWFSTVKGLGNATFGSN